MSESHIQKTHTHTRTHERQRYSGYIVTTQQQTSLCVAVPHRDQAKNKLAMSAPPVHTQETKTCLTNDAETHNGANRSFLSTAARGRGVVDLDHGAAIGRQRVSKVALSVLFLVGVTPSPSPNPDF